MFSKSLSCVLFMASLASAHFNFKYPEARGDHFAQGASQWGYPCANVNQTSATNRTLWPIDGGSVSLKLFHSWNYIFVNLGLGTDYPKFNISLTPKPLNETGKGNFCLPKLALPSGVVPVEGQNASIQVVTLGQSGNAMYGCADITFSRDATVQSGEICTNQTGVSAAVLGSSSAIPPPTSGSTVMFDSTLAAGFALVLSAVVMGHLM